MIRKLEKFLNSVYGIEASLIKLSGYDDLNFLVKVDHKPVYVLKLSQGVPIAFFEAQQKIFRILDNLDDYLFPRNVADKDGNPFHRYDDSYIARLLNYIPGKFIAEIPKNKSLLDSFGRFLARMDKALFDHHDPLVESRYNPWDIRNFPEIRNKITQISDPHLKKLIHYCLVQYDLKVKPELPDLRRSIIHNDANDWNVLADGEKIIGIIDFGDLAYTYTINELAIACTYMAMDSKDPVSAILPLIQGYHQVLPLMEKEISILYYLIAARLGISLTMSFLTKKKDPGNQYVGIHEEMASHLMEQWFAIHPQRAEDCFRQACEWASTGKRETAGFAVKRKKFFSKALSLSYERPIVMDKAAFQYMYGDYDKTFVDCVNNIMHVGHAHPEVVEAGQRQMAILNTNTRYYYDSLSNYAEKLLDYFPKKLNKVFFVNSGSAASDLAVRLARNYTQRKDLIVMEYGYHGNTTTGIEISHYKFGGKGGSGAEKHIHVAPIPDTYRGRYKEDDPEVAEKYAGDIDPFLSHKIAAFICEPIVGCGGQILLPDGYLKLVYEKVRRAGGTCIVDEVQTGFGRVGSHFWAFEMYDVLPDIVILGKPMGNGHPLGAVVCTEEIATAFENGMEFFSSFGGNPVSCEIGIAVLKVIESERLQAHAGEIGNFLLEQFNSLKKRHSLIGDVRGTGLFFGIELISDQNTLTPATSQAYHLINEMKSLGFLLSTDGPYNQVIKFKPPMCFSKKNALSMIQAFDNLLPSL